MFAYYLRLALVPYPLVFDYYDEALGLYKSPIFRFAELLIFFSTFGGLMFFGATGFILGPILAALFVTAWEMFGTAFRTALAEPGSAAADSDYRPPV